jgi:hypothetical protein
MSNETLRLFTKTGKGGPLPGLLFLIIFTRERERESCGCALVIDAMARGDDRIAKLKTLDKYPFIRRYQSGKFFIFRISHPI